MSLTTTTTISSANFRLILDALDDYAKQTGIDLTKGGSPFLEDLQKCDSSDAVLDLLKVKAKEFKDYRDGNRKLIDWLNPVVKVVHAFSGFLGEAVSLVPFQPAKAIFVGIDVLLAAAGDVSSSYDALLDLFECVGSFLKRLHIYTEIPFNPAMADVIVKIMVEVLSVLALATKQIKQGRFKKFAKKLLGESDIEAVLQRLDRLTQEEARMTVAQTLGVVHGLVNNLKVVMDDGKTSTDGIRQTLVALQEAANETNKMKRDQLQKEVRSWLSPPDPSKNHNIARGDHHDGTAEWFTQGSTFKKWKMTGSLLWIHGKPGSGKSILCSTLIQEAKGLRNAGLAILAYFYFDFRDTVKQDLRGLLSSLLSQLCAKSDVCYNILSDLYSDHDAGSQQPDNSTLTECLVKMLKHPGQPPIYIIVDALDECPNTSGIISPRERVLELLEELVELQLPNVRVCVTSRPEADIRDVLEPLASYPVSLHDEGGQKQDIVDYISSVVKLDRKMRRWRLEDKNLVIDTLSQRVDGMFRWVVCQLEILRRSFPAAIRHALEELPQTLDETYERALLGLDKEKSEYAHRLFQCLTVSVRPLRAEELAEVLAVQFDGEQVPHYHPDWRPEDAKDAVLSACSSLITVVNADGSPVVQFSHFSVKEFLTSNRLATAGENLSHYHVDLQSAHTVLAKSCISVLLGLDDEVDKEKMKNFPLANYAARHWVEHGQFGNVSSGIQHLMERLFDRGKPHFAAWVWIYNIDRPWPWVEHMSGMHPKAPKAGPLYYATLCGFHALVERLTVTCPGDVNGRGGFHGTPLHAAFSKGHVAIALWLLEHGADINALDDEKLSSLHRASQSGRVDVVKLLLEHHADANIQNGDMETPLKLASVGGEIEVARLLIQHDADLNLRDDKGWSPLESACRLGHVDVVRLLLQSGAALDSRDDRGWTPLEFSSYYGREDVARFLLESGATVDSRDNDNWTPLIIASDCGHLAVVRVLLDHGAHVNAQRANLSTPLHHASANGNLDIANLLLENGADVDIRDNKQETPLAVVSAKGFLEIARLLVDRGANVDSRDMTGCSSFHNAAKNGHLDIMKMLLQRDSVDVNIRNGNDETPLDLASGSGRLEVVHFLIENGAIIDSRDISAWTPLHTASRNGHLDVVKLLLQHDIDINVRNKNKKTPLDLSSRKGNPEVSRFLIENGADLNARDDEGWAPLHTAAGNGHLDVLKLLIEKGADVSMRNNSDETPLDLASRISAPEIVEFLENIHSGGHSGSTLLVTTSQNRRSIVAESSLTPRNDAAPPKHGENASLHSASKDGYLDAVRSLLDRGVDINARNTKEETPLDVASTEGRLEVAKLLIERGADVNCRDSADWTPLQSASRFGHLDIARLLLDHGADVEARTDEGWTPLHRASRNGYLDIARLLLNHGADVNVKQQGQWTPLHLASAHGYIEIVELLLEHGAIANGVNDNSRTPSREAFANGHHRIVQLLSKYGGRGA